MKKIAVLLFLITTTPSFGQGIVVDAQLYTPQELIEEVLVDSNCITDVLVTNAVGGDFGGVDKSFGFFEAGGTGFPFENGLVMSTGRLQNVPGPNTSLSDDNAPQWLGDGDLETVLDESNTINATILEFDFTTAASEVSFRYLFASEEYQEGNPNTCRFSDLFGFLIRPVGEQQYVNIALVPDTQTPVKVTTVHPEIPNGCAAENEFYFDQFNGTSVPINFNGQTAILTASAQVQPNTPYHVKLVIADEQNFRFDSAVFLEGGSFKLAADLGENRLLTTGNALCENETLSLDATTTGATNYHWFKDGVLQANAVATFTVMDSGLYEVIILLDNGCESFGEIVVEYDRNPEVFPAVLVQCDTDGDGRTVFNLLEANDTLTDNDNELIVRAFFTSEALAMANEGEIPDPRSFENTTANQVLYARIENRSGCASIATVMLTTSFNEIIVPVQTICDTDGTLDGATTIEVSSITSIFESEIPSGSSVEYFRNLGDALFEVDALNTTFLYTDSDGPAIYARVENQNGCFAIITVFLEIVHPPKLLEDTVITYCANTFPAFVSISSGIANTSLFTYVWTLNGVPLSNTEPTLAINQVGTYEVIVTNGAGCSARRTITVVGSEKPTITEVGIQDLSANNTITVTVTGNGEYEYALDTSNGVFQDSNVFTNVSSGSHLVYVRDRSGCGIALKEVFVIGVPPFFTPNGDGINDVWQVKGTRSENPVASLIVFDRFGKTLYTARGAQASWDGTYQGNPMPVNGYWYQITLADGRSVSGTFTLIRR